MHPKKLPNSVSESTHITNRKAGTADPLSRAAFTSAIVAALKDLENRRPPVANDLCQRAYQKLQYDLPLVSPEELEGLTDTLRASLQLKSGQPLFPITSKLLENVVAGARAPVTAGPPSSSTQSQSSTSAAGSSAAGNSSSTAGTEAGAADAAPPAGTTTAAASANDASGRNGGTAPQPSLAASTSESVFPCLVDVSLVRPDQQRLCRAFRALCAVIFVQLVSHSLAVSEQDTWALLYATRSDQDENKDESEGPGNPEVFLRDGTADGAAQGTASSSFADKEPTQTAELSARLGGAVATTASNADTPSPDHHNQQQQESSPHFVSGGKVFAPGCSRQDAAYRPGTLTSLTSGCSERALEGIQESIEDGSLRQRTKELRSCILYEECQAADEDGDDFVFEDLEVPSVTAPAASNGNLSHATESPPTPPPYSWPALRARLVWLSGQVSYALLDEPDLWRDGELLQGVFQLLRALGAHRYAQELQPLLHAYVGLVADRIATEPSELSCLDNLWDAVGLQCVASLPQVARHRAAAGSARGGGGVERGQGLLLAEATTCLSLVATLAGQLTGASAKLRLWQQVHKHMLPLLERCLGELARTVGPNTKQAVAAKASAHLTQQQQLKGPGAEEVAAIVLVCQVLDFYVQQRPGNADLAASLKGTGVLASLSVLFAAVGSLPGAEPLRSAALCCAASSKELHAWMLAVPGVDKTLAAPPFQEGGAHEAHGAVWELLGNNGSSSLALSILAGGAATEKAVRVHALLQLLAKAAACRGGRGPGCSGLWSPAVERSMRDLFVSLRQEQAGGVAAVSRRLVSEDVGHGRGAAAAGRGLSTATEAQNQTAAVGPDSNQDEGVNEEDDENEEEKLHLLDPTALQRRRARQLHPACWRILKQLLTGADVEYGSGPLHTATKAVTTDGSLKSHLHSFETLLAKPWTNKQVQQAQTHGFFWRLVPHLGVERLQGPAALLLARCARLRPALLLPLIQRLCAVLPLLINSPRQDVRQAGLCLLGLLWRAATDGASQLPSAILATPRLMEALTARADEGNFDALWAVRELAADGRGVPALERCGALQAVCRALKHIAAAAAAAAPPGGNAEAESGREGGKEHGGDREGRRGRGHGYRKLAGEAPAAESGAAVSVGDQKNERGSKRAGVTAGGDVVERAASGVLVAECLAAFSVEHFAVLLMCDSQKVPSKWATPERNRVPERLISLLLLTGADLDKEAQEGGNEGTEEEEANEEGGQRQGGHGNGKTVSNPGSGSVDGGSREGANAAEATFRESPSNLKPPGRAAPDGAVSTDPGSAARRSEDVYSEDFASEAEGQGSEGTDTGRTRGVGGNSGDGDGGGGGGGAGDSGSEGRRSGTVEEGRSGNGVAAAAPAGSGGGGGGVKGSIGGGEQGTAAAGRGSGSGSGSGGDGDDVRKKDHQADPRVSLVRKAQRQLHDALLRSLYIIASSGHCQKPQQVVQEALRGAGDPAVERLAAVLRGRPRTQSGASDAAAKEFPSLAACCSASYLLWLIASGDFSHSEASELNVLRSRMGKDAPSRHERETDTGGDTGGSSQYFTCGFGVVQAVTELLLVHLPVWQNPDFGDCVPSVGTTTLPPPPPAVNVGINNGDGRSGGSIAAVGTVAPGGEVATGAAGAGPVPRLGPQYGAGSGGVLNGAVNPRPTRMSSKVACNAEDVGGGRILSTPQTSETQATDPRVAHEGGGDAPATVRRMVPPLPIASTTGLLLTPRDTRGAACSAASPQERYGRGDSSDDDVAGSGGDAHGGNNGTGYSSGTADGGMKRNDSSATADRLSSTQDLDLSNVIDSSVELTGKEQLMRIIAAAGSALSKEGELRQGDEGCEGMVSEQGEPGAEHTPMAAANGDPPDGSAAAVNPTTAPQAATANTAPSDGPTQGPLDRAESPSDKSDASAGSGCTPLDVPVSGGDSSGGGKDGAARLPPLTVARPPALVLPTDAAGRRTPPPPPPRPSVVPTPTTWLNAVRFVRQQHTCVSSPTAAEVQELQTCCMGLLAAVALSAGGCRAVCSQPNLLPYIASLLELADVSDGDAATASSPAAAALGSSGQELRLQLLALLTNLSLHEAGAAALTTAVSSATSRPLGEGLYRTAEMAIRLISGSTTSWRLGAQLLEACFTIMTNIHRSQAVLRLAADHSSGEQRDSFRLATEALRVPLAPSIGVVDRTRIRAAAARCLDSAIAAYEGVGRSLAPQRRSGIIRAPSAKAGSHRAATAIAAPAAEEKALISELIWLLAGGAAIAAAAGGGAVASAAAAAERAAIDGAGALWQLMASGTVHPDDVISDLEPPLVSVLGSTRAAVDSERPAALRLAALGLVSCLARGAAVARRLWTSPLLPAVLKTHAFARRRCADGGAESWLPVLECVRGVCQMLCRACHRADRGDVVGPDKRVDKWGLTERMLSELRCKLEYDADEDAIMLVLREEATEALGKGGDGSGGGSGEYNDDYDE